VRTGEGIETAAAGCDTIVHAATNAQWRARETEVEGTRHVVEAARKTGAHLIYVSIVGVDRHRMPYYKAKWVAEQVVEASDIPWTILRATQFHDLLDRILGFRFVPVPRRTPFQPVDGAEVADVLADLVDAGPSGRAPDVGGPQVLTIKELNDARARITRRLAVLVPVPAVWFVRDFVDGRHLPTDGVKGRVTWEEWLRKRNAS
jgi:uncharacterized protein YbjT (DUF2867 family)